MAEDLPMIRDFDALARRSPSSRAPSVDDKRRMVNDVNVDRVVYYAQAWLGSEYNTSGCDVSLATIIDYRHP